MVIIVAQLEEWGAALNKAVGLITMLSTYTKYSYAQMLDLNLITLFLLIIFVHSRKCKIIVYLSLKNASKVCNFHFEISELICPSEKLITRYRNVHLILIHIIIHISCCCRIIFLP